MKKSVLGWGTAIAVLLSLAFLFGCSQSMLMQESPEDTAVSIEELLGNLDSLGAVQSKALFGASSIPKPGGEAFSPEELSAYISGIKVDFASYLAERTVEKPYMVMPVRLRSGGQSGLMWVPVSLGRKLSVPMISLQHGTQTYWQCAPSRYNPNPLAILSSVDVAGAFQNYLECITGALMASAGYIVVMPDYPGFGDSREPHPYVNLSLGDSVRMMALRAQAVLRTLWAGARHNGRMYLIGYSEGGFATMAAAKTFQDNGMSVTAAVPCAGSYDMAGTMVMDVLSGRESLAPYYIPYTVFGYASVYRNAEPEAWDYARLLKEPLPSLLDLMFSGNYPSAAISSYIPTNVTRYLLTDELVGELATKSGPVYGRLLQNTAFMTGWIPNMLVQMIHCPEDDIVPFANTLAAYDAFKVLPNVLTPIPVPPIPWPDGLPDIADIHLRAFPTAMLAGFAFIDSVEGYF